jgi:hypothetical protein
MLQAVLRKFVKPLWLIGVMLVCIGASAEFFIFSWGSGFWWGRLSYKWGPAFIVFVLFCIALTVVTTLILYAPHRLASFRGAAMRWRERLGWTRWIFIFLLIAIPAWFYNYSKWSELFTTFYLRVFIFTLVLLFLGYLLSTGRSKLLEPAPFIVGILSFTVFYLAADFFAEVTNYPFAMSWSEGNRFYDYSLVFGQRLYDYSGVIQNPYFAPARYMLWGLPFLFSGLPIWVHRAWDATLYTCPLLLAGWLLFRRVSDNYLRLGLILWTVLFLNQGSIYPHFVVPALLVIAFTFTENFWVRAISLVFASVFIGLGRWTWAVGPGVWGALIDLFLYYPKRKGNIIARLAPTATLTLLGVIPGILASWLPTIGATSSLTFKQPLLWYRMFPNPTYPPGILIGALLAVGPLAALPLWAAFTRRWPNDLFQGIAALGASVALLGAGIVVSAKIGGGSNLHNLDLFFFTVLLLAALSIHQLLETNTWRPFEWPWLIKMFLFLCLFIPVYNVLSIEGYVRFPSQDEVQIALTAVRDKVDSSEALGEVLFLDQRQLVTFGYIKDEPFVPEYEKKFMMDQAMAANVDYFRAYYQDLARKRFVLIVSEPLRTEYYTGDLSRNFNEENDAWVYWVSNPTLCFYDPVLTFDNIGVELLVPRRDTSACDLYLKR